MRTTLSPYPSGPTGKDAIPITASSGNQANATATATLAAGGIAPPLLTYISGFEVTADGATAAAAGVNVTVTGTQGGTLTYSYGVAALGSQTPLVVEFNPPIPANAFATAIVVTVPALGAGNAHSCVVAHGFQLPYSS